MLRVKKSQFHAISRGATILEVMISVLLLTFGVLALMAAQLRSVASIGEAENRSIVSQAAEALAEGMQINPTMAQYSVSGTDVYRRTYTEYTNNRSNVVVSIGAGGTAPTAPVGTDQTKASVAAFHISEFEYILRTQLPNVSVLSYAICRDKPNPVAPSINTSGALTSNCNPAGNAKDTTVIKVAWRMGNGKNDANTSKNTTEYTYMFEVGS